jgi:hypothetical protein
MPHAAWRDTSLPQEIYKQALSTLLQTISGTTHEYPPRDATLYGVLEQLATLEKPATAHGCLLIPDKENDTVFIAREWQRVMPCMLTEKSTLWDGRFTLENITQNHHDIVLKPLGDGGVAALIAEDIVLPALPLAIVSGFPAFWRVESLVGVPHIGYEPLESLPRIDFYSKTTS